MLEYDVLEGEESGGPLVLLMHGRGAERTDLAALRRFLPRDASLVLPDAPFEAAPWGYGPGRAWYRYIGGTRPEPESFDEAQRALAELVDHVTVEARHPEAKLVLGGFSQGGTMGLGFAARNPGVAGAILNFSGFFPDHPTVNADALKGTPIFWGHGISDPAILFDYAVRGRATLAAAGAELEARDYRMGHGISAEELRDAVAWLERIVR